MIQPGVRGGDTSADVRGRLAAPAGSRFSKAVDGSTMTRLSRSTEPRAADISGQGVPVSRGARTLRRVAVSQPDGRCTSRTGTRRAETPVTLREPRRAPAHAEPRRARAGPHSDARSATRWSWAMAPDPALVEQYRRLAAVLHHAHKQSRRPQRDGGERRAARGQDADRHEPRADAQRVVPAAGAADRRRPAPAVAPRNVRPARYATG